MSERCNINVICGENSTGKTTLLKVMYSVLKPLGKGYKEATTKEIGEKMFVDKYREDKTKRSKEKGDYWA